MNTDLELTYNAIPCSNNEDRNNSECAPRLSLYLGLLGCGGNSSASFSTFTSPLYPDPYPNNAECIYQVTQAVGLFITIEIVEIDIDCEIFGDLSDFIELRDGDSESSPLIGRFCGNMSNDLPKEMKTSQNNLWIRSDNK